MLTLAWLPTIRLNRPDLFESGKFTKLHARCIWGLLSVSTLVVCLMWLIVLSSNHDSAVNDFAEQIANSINTTFVAKLSSSSTMAQQATQIWFHTGAVTTSLSVFNKWTTLLMDDFYTNNGMSTMQFGTQMNGLEQGAKGTASGARVLSRTSSTGCRQTLTYNSATDATSSDSATYPDDCYFDPRYITLLKTIQASLTSQCVSPAMSVTLFCCIASLTLLLTICLSTGLPVCFSCCLTGRATLCCLYPLRR